MEKGKKRFLNRRNETKKELSVEKQIEGERKRGGEA